MTTSVEVRPAHPAVGQKVTFIIHAHDDAAQDVTEGQAFGDGPAMWLGALRPMCQRYGSWTPPAPQSHDWDVTLTHVYQRAGTFPVSFSLGSGTPGWVGCMDPYASQSTASTAVTVTPEATQQSTFESDFTCDPSVHVTGARAVDDGEALEFGVDGSCPDLDPSQASVSVNLRNKSGQTVYFPDGIDAVVHLDNGGRREDVHVTDPHTTSLAPGQQAHLTKHVDVGRHGSYWPSGTITYVFVPPAA